MLCSLASHAADSITISKDYLPHVHGVIRSRWEMATETGESRFQVRNARIMIDGKVGPLFQYYLNTDFCDRGKIRILDVWGQVNAFKWMNVRLGQFRQPFGMDSFRGPSTFVFANRSFIGKQMCNVRAVGMMLSSGDIGIPLKLSAGMFNAADMTDHDTWSHHYAYAARAIYTLRNLDIYTGFQSVIPDSVRTNLANLGVSWKADRLTLEGEYMYKHYTNRAHRAAHGFLVTADYAIPLKHKVFNRLSFQGRFDGMTNHSNARRNDAGQLTTDDPARRRLTLGSTISYLNGKYLKGLLRINFEKYFYGHSPYSKTDGDKLLAELVITF